MKLRITPLLVTEFNHRIHRSTLVLALLCVAMIGQACATSAFLGYRIHPNCPGEEPKGIELSGLEQPVQVFVDKYGIPHIEAQNERDLLRVTGYMQARDRFFAMDAMRRLACGRLSELIGEQALYNNTTVDFDKTMRGWGFEALAEQDAADLKPEDALLMQAYVEGINAALASHRYIEYRLLGVDPVPWTLVDTFALGRLNAWTVTHNWQQEFSRFLLALQGGTKRSMSIHPQEPWQGMTSLPAEGPAHPLLQAIAPELEQLFPKQARPRTSAFGQKLARGIASTVTLLLGGASNGWAVAGEHSASGRPMMANDPHLLHMLPSLLYQQSMKTPGFEVIGATMAGLPYVLMGHNGKVAWGMTSAVADAEDLVVEMAEGSERVRTPEGSAPITTEEHIIRVREGSKFREVRVTYRRTPHGPLLNDMYPKLLPPGSPLVAIRTVSTDGARSLMALRKAAEASNVTELRTALIQMESPPQIWECADGEGNIGLIYTGALPIRRGYRGTFPVPGWSADYGWDGVVNEEDLPFAVSQTGYFSHANNLLVDPHYGDVFVGVDSSPSYRQERISALLNSQDIHSAEDLQRMQLDTTVERGRRLAPIMVTVLRTPKREGKMSPNKLRAVELLANWDYNATVDSAAAAIFFSTYRKAVLLALDDELEGAALAFLMAQRYSTNVADLWFDSEDHPVWDDLRTPEVETRSTVLHLALTQALEELEAVQGPDPEKFRWGALHNFQPRHLFGGRKALASTVNLEAMEVVVGWIRCGRRTLIWEIRIIPSVLWRVPLCAWS